MVRYDPGRCVTVARLEGFEETVRAEAERRIESFGRETIEHMVEQVNDLLRNAPVGIGGGASADDWNLDAIADSAEIRHEGDRWVAEWTAETDDGIPLIDVFEFGVEPFDIEGDPVLHWTDEETGEDVFRAKVRHPGIPAVAAVRITRRRIEAKIERGDIEEITFS